MQIARAGNPLRSRIGTMGTVDVAMEGRSLLPQIRGQESGPEFVVTEVRRGPADPGYRSIRTESWKLIESLAGERQLYNLMDDPMEKVNLAGQDTSRAEGMSRTLRDWVQMHLKDGDKDPMRIVFGK
jgi:arylsulfatase A-like enzyme